MSDNPRVAEIDDVMPGKLLGTKSITVAERDTRDHLSSLGLPEIVGEYAPYLLLGTEPWGWPGAYVEYWLGGVAQAMSWYSARPVPIGAKLRAEARVSDRYVVRNRECSVITADLFDEAGDLVLTGSGIYSAKVDPAAVRADVPRRDAPAAETADLEIIASAEPRTVRLDREMSRLFWRHRADLGDGNFHTSIEAAQAAGLPDVLIGSSHLAALAGERAQTLFGARWLSGGTLTTRFLKPVIAGDEVTIIVHRLAGSEDRIPIRGEMANQRGDVVMTISGGLALKEGKPMTAATPSGAKA
ncbi:MAG: MaoC family dehydratase [Novosphingobium sp.]|nr:MaoC family dehydratase [Novosphingobium sp.]